MRGHDHRKVAGLAIRIPRPGDWPQKPLGGRWKLPRVAKSLLPLVSMCWQRVISCHSGSSVFRSSKRHLLLCWLPYPAKGCQIAHKVPQMRAPKVAFHPPKKRRQLGSSLLFSFNHRRTHNLGRAVWNLVWLPSRVNRLDWGSCSSLRLGGACAAFLFLLRADFWQNGNATRVSLLGCFIEKQKDPPRVSLCASQCIATIRSRS